MHQEKKRIQSSVDDDDDEKEAENDEKSINKSKKVKFESKDGKIFLFYDFFNGIIEFI